MQDLGAVGLWCVAFDEWCMVHGRVQVVGAVGVGWGVDRGYRVGFRV